ncbi:3,4-dihydroxy-2-butanone-4-phosphate synthase [Natronococcus pandeyae]|uniref:3,4-dihydroxy-2-butanone 4-phosphate synthase n=1 Tax=Natronococcus pandeyae TaxID=2055836 RepID=A0A8J8TQ54_9EURY|nr:3,4-dihydroxy-2-butanone-4-phosphate synthase [Natronococcus pandeyae]TYL38496.1 3,4-dihydroxy-2-butanone-4-phosphate synthase [Natronococcus pandeyae]
MSNSRRQLSMGVDEAVTAFRAGSPVLIHDASDREGETDLVYPARAVRPDTVRRLRNDAGGLVCVAVADRVARQWDLPFIQEALNHPTTANRDLEYDERSSFSLTVNHHDTDTGITDEDRALTIPTLGTAAAAPENLDFPATFRAPGHVYLLRAAPDSLGDRQGHTELGIALAEMAELSPAVVVCEMLDDETGRARSPVSAKAYADRNDLQYVDGERLVEQFG